MTRFSAWDVAGAVVWTLAAGLCWRWVLTVPAGENDITPVVALILSFPAVYCWARWHHATDFNALEDLVMGVALILSAQIDIRKDNHHD